MKRISLLVLALAAMPFAAQASCGSAYCPVNTQWDTQGVWTDPGLRFDLRYEYIKQDQPRVGEDSVGVGAIPGHHDEVETINQNVIATLDYAFNQHWGVTLAAPVSKREHYHVHNHHGVPLDERWDFTEVGDVRLTGRYQQAVAPHTTLGLQLGFKLPTGTTSKVNSNGDEAERTLQPGTGTTDLILSPYIRHQLAHGSVFGQLHFQQALDYFGGYKPGKQFGADIGYRHIITDRLAGLAQVNYSWKDADAGIEAESDLTGRTSVSISPGLSYAVTEKAQLYGYVNIPVYQHVRGIQLTEDYSVVTGISFRF